MAELLRFQIAKYYSTRAVRGVITLFPLLGEGVQIFLPFLGKVRMGNNQYPPQPSLIREGVTCHCEGATHVAHSHNIRRAAFTLAEVLITLGIIGVVAAMTIPTLIQKNQQKALEVSFKKSYANLHNAFNLVVAEGIPVFQGDGHDYNSEFAQAVYAKYKQLGLISDKEKKEYRENARNFNKEATMQIPQCSQYMGSSGAFITPDGSILSIVQNCGALWFTIDSNGLHKGPNALGHDIFIFKSYKNSTKLIPADLESELECDDSGNCHYNNTEDTKDKCSNTSKSNLNGATCATYALQNRCPWDSSKTYWECLP